MRIAISLPNFNGSKYLRGAIESVLEQDWRDRVLVIVDGQSSDNSHCIIEEYCERDDVLWIKEPDTGISDAVNKSIRAVHADVHGFLGSDDVMLPGALSAVAYYANQTDADGWYFNKYLYFVQERQFILRKPPCPEITTENLLIHGTITDLQTIFYRRRVYEKYQLNPENKTCMDYELLFELARDNAFLAHIDEQIVLERMDGNISHANEHQIAEACAVAQRYAGDYTGAMWSDRHTGRVVEQKPDAYELLARSEAKLADMTIRETEAREELANTRVELATAYAELATTRAELDTAHAELATTRPELATTRAELSTARAETEELRGKLAAVMASTSWKMTGPLRRIVGALR